MQVFCFGHSITQGFWDPGEGWVARLKQELDRRSLEGDEYFEVYNLGVSGDDSGNLLERFRPEIEARLWEEVGTIVILQVGANDTIREEGELWTGPEEFRSNLRELIDQAKSTADRVYVIGEAYTAVEGQIPWTDSDQRMKDERLRSYVEIQRQVCDSEDVEMIDLRKAVSYGEWEQMLEDGLHPDARGHRFIFESLEEAMDIL
ncbi:MAG: SGNH/GDSL hydrolase family protein [Candidatus Nanohaloarchaea archaeon]